METNGTVESLFEDYKGLRTLLAKDPSGLAALERLYPKAVLLSSASWLETRIVDVVRSMVRAHAPAQFDEFIYRKGLARQYHTLFDWDGRHKGVNTFFALFGNESKERCASQLRDDPAFMRVAADFIGIGSLRNQMVHTGFAKFALDMTAEEVITMHRSAVNFPEYVVGLVGAPSATD